MIKKTTLLLLLMCSSGFIFGQTINDFEVGSPNVTFAGPGGSAADYTVVDNPNPTGNPQSKVARLVRPTQTAGHWWYLIKFPLATSITVPAGTTKYLHVLAHYPANADIAVRFNATVTGGVPNNGAGAGEGGDTRPDNSLSNFNQWQDLVFPLTAGATDFTVDAIVFIYDAGFQNGPAASNNFVLNNTTDIAYVDEFNFSDSSTPVTLSNDEFKLDSSLSMHPNPAQSVFKIKTSNSIEITDVLFYNILGAEVQKGISPIATNEFDVSGLPTGMYLVKITDNKGSEVTKRLIKK